MCLPMEVDGEGRRGLFHNVSSYQDNNPMGLGTLDVSDLFRDNVSTQFCEWRLWGGNCLVVCDSSTASLEDAAPR